MIRHYPVMFRNVLRKIQNLKMSRTIKIADCNFGFGGHSHKILKTFPNTIIQGFDLDQEVISYYNQNYQSQLTNQQQKRLQIFNKNYTCLQKQNNFQKYQVILADFGFNNYHISTERGFSWLRNQELDMRYGKHKEMCKDLIQRCSLIQIRQIIQKYTDLKQAKYVAESIFSKKPIKTTFQLRDAVVGAFQKDKQTKIAQVFQAFRISTNNQLEDLQKLVQLLEKRLSPNGIALLITFHSIERDRIIKKIKDKYNIFYKIVIQSPDQIELSQNTMSRSAKLISFRKKL